MKSNGTNLSAGLPTARHANWFVGLFAVLGGLLLVFVILPILSTLFSIDLDSLWATLTDQETLASLWLTFYAAAMATVLAFVCGIPLAYILARYNFIFKEWIEGIINLPIVIPHTAAGVALLLAFGRQAALGKLAGQFGIQFFDEVAGIVVGMLFVSLPYLVNGSRAAFALVDPELERVAQTEGATRWQAFTRVTFPLAWRGVLASALMMWGRGISEFGAVVILAYHPKIIPVLVYERFSGFGLDAAQPVAAVLILASLMVFVLIHVITKGKTES